MTNTQTVQAGAPETQCGDCRYYTAKNGKRMRRLCDKHMEKRIKSENAKLPKWNPRNNPLSRMLRF